MPLSVVLGRQHLSPGAELDDAVFEGRMAGIKRHDGDDLLLTGQGTTIVITHLPSQVKQQEGNGA